MDLNTALAILGLERNCTPLEAREAYLDLVKVWHPSLRVACGAGSVSSAVATGSSCVVTVCSGGRAQRFVRGRCVAPSRPVGIDAACGSMARSLLKKAAP